MLKFLIKKLLNKTSGECRLNKERPTGKKNPTIERKDGGKICDKIKLILTEIFPSMHET